MVDPKQVAAVAAQQAAQQKSPLDDNEPGVALTPDQFPGATEKVDVETRQQGREIEALDVEIVDDTPEQDRGKPRAPRAQPVDVPDDELSKYSDSVQKRIKQMSFEYHTERRAREEQERQANEAVRIAQRLREENLRLQETLTKGRDAFNTEAKGRAEASIAQARQAYKAAYEAGDPEKMASAAEDIAKWSAEKVRVEAMEAQAKAQAEAAASNAATAATQAKEREVRPQRQPPPEPSIETKRWMKDNQWFGQDEDATAYAMHLHQRAVTREFLRPDTAEYFRFIDDNHRKRFPELHATDGESRSTRAAAPAATSRAATTSVVAPVTRTSAGRKVQLTTTQVALARRLGVTPEQYAREILREQGAE